MDQNLNIERDWSFGEFLDRITALTYHLSEFKLAKGDRVLLCYPPGLDFFVAFWACLALGLVAVPVCPPDPFHPYVGVDGCDFALITPLSVERHGKEDRSCGR